MRKAKTLDLLSYLRHGVEFEVIDNNYLKLKGGATTVDKIGLLIGLFAEAKKRGLGLILDPEEISEFELNVFRFKTSQLSEGEQLVLELARTGIRCREIASKLHKTEFAVRTNMRDIRIKMGFKTTVELLSHLAQEQITVEQIRSNSNYMESIRTVLPKRLDTVAKKVMEGKKFKVIAKELDLSSEAVVRAYIRTANKKTGTSGKVALGIWYRCHLAYLEALKQLKTENEELGQQNASSNP